MIIMVYLRYLRYYVIWRKQVKINEILKILFLFLYFTNIARIMKYQPFMKGRTSCQDSCCKLFTVCRCSIILCNYFTSSVTFTFTFSILLFDFKTSRIVEKPSFRVVNVVYFIISVYYWIWIFRKICSFTFILVVKFVLDLKKFDTSEGKFDLLINS